MPNYLPLKRKDYEKAKEYFDHAYCNDDFSRLACPEEN
jgi:hypothetical protein